MTDHIIFELSLKAERVDISERKRKKNQGSNWCWSGTRKVIYVCGGHKCTWCGIGTDIEGVVLSLDHIIPNAFGGSNHRSNLVTACVKCNSRRGDRLIPDWINYMKASNHYSSKEVSKAIVRLFKAYDNHTTKAWNEYRKAAIASGYLIKTPKGYK